jgi:6-phosphofructokinase 2
LPFQSARRNEFSEGFLTLAEEGALFVTQDGAFHAQSPTVELVNGVGAGDSFVGGLVWSLASDHSHREAFRWGVAAGSAAVLNPGTELCHAQDVKRLFDHIALVPV